MIRSLAALTVYAVGTAFLAGAARAADIPAQLRIDRVTLYQQGAIVTRSGAVDLPAGAHRLIIQGLPAGIEAKSLHVAVEDASARLGAIEIERVNEGRFVSDAERALRLKLEQKSDQRAILEDEAATAQLTLKLLDALAANPTGLPGKGGVESASLNSVIATVGTSSAAARMHLRETSLKMRVLDREIETLRADLAKVATQSKQSTEVRAAVETRAASTVTVTVSYRVADAGWHVIYEARLDTARKRLTLVRQGEVRQGSGEDWKDVALTLTTARPADDAATPVVTSLFLSLENPYAVREALAAKRTLTGVTAMTAPAAAPANAGNAMTADRSSAAAATAPSETAEASATDYLTEYRVPARASLASDREPRLYPIASDDFDVDLIARIVPAAGRAAHLEAYFKYQGELPLESGRLELYRDGAFVGEAATRALLPGAEVRMPFGIDERIRFAVHDEPTQSSERGLIGKVIVKETRQRFEVTSYHPAPIAIELIDRLPVSRNADVRVDSLPGATPPTVRDLEGRAGVMLWRLEAEPRTTVAVRRYYSVEYPRDRRVFESTGDAID